MHIDFQKLSKTTHLPCISFSESGSSNRGTYFDFCDRSYTVTGICQYSTSAFKKKTFKIRTLNVFFCNKKSQVSYLFAQEEKMACLWVAKIKSEVKGHHHYNDMHTIGDKLEYVRESENHHIQGTCYFSLLEENQSKNEDYWKYIWCFD